MKVQEKKMMVKRFFRTIFFIEIIQGLSLTLSRLFSHAVTRRYPKVKRPAKPGFRGLHALVRDPDTGKAKCVGCCLCAAICPSKCIYIYTDDGPDHRKIVERYEIEVLRCVYCALCVEACPFGAVVLTEHYEYSDYSRDAIYMTKEKLLSNWDRYMEGQKGAEYFKRFWRPMPEDFVAHKDQAVFRKMKD